MHADDQGRERGLNRILVTDASCRDGKRFVVPADEKLNCVSGIGICYSQRDSWENSLLQKSASGQGGQALPK
jgi:hypothetical protein